ncbi:hypothetical protein W02_35530 [Nitrospira sp. KM1]|uniref:hypothetical protein n=1 Tax=Nitrospira sp. KM1 TaxID=1936990 RepID=UPI0013A70CF9|nr:hypothetical protein [Nitrospira sp. KM1]BCA56413.1 hypothetical protein W02_35530 [Nitrospira sp. KM1]
MKKSSTGQLQYSPSDLMTYLASPFASWMDRYHLECPGSITPDELTEDDKLIARTGAEHERAVLGDMRTAGRAIVEVSTRNFAQAQAQTRSAVTAEAPVIYQAALCDGPFFGFADFLLLDERGLYQVWDTKLARSSKPYYAIQLCCYSDMLSSVSGRLPQTFGVILGSKERVMFRLESFIHYYRHAKKTFLDLQDRFTGNLRNRPLPFPRAEHGRWTSHADRFFRDRDHLVLVANITSSQIRKLAKAGIHTTARRRLRNEDSRARLDDARKIGRPSPPATADGRSQARRPASAAEP